MHDFKSLALRAPLQPVALAFALAAGIAFSFPQAATAAGSDDSTTPEPCPTGQTRSTTTGNCETTSGALDDQELYDQGERLALHGQYERAIKVLRTVSNQNDPRVLNYIGYSFRKMGELDKGIRYYAKALAIDPNYVRAREYLGEGYVAAGRMAEARDQLQEIEKRCGTGCREYVLLAQVIVEAGGVVVTN